VAAYRVENHPEPAPRTVLAARSELAVVDVAVVGDAVGVGVAVAALHIDIALPAAEGAEHGC